MSLLNKISARNEDRLGAEIVASLRPETAPILLERLYSDSAQREVLLRVVSAALLGSGERSDALRGLLAERHRALCAPGACRPGGALWFGRHSPREEYDMFCEEMSRRKSVSGSIVAICRLSSEIPSGQAGGRCAAESVLTALVNLLERAVSEEPGAEQGSEALADALHELGTTGQGASAVPPSVGRRIADLLRGGLPPWPRCRFTLQTSMDAIRARI